MWEIAGFFGCVALLGFLYGKRLAYHKKWPYTSFGERPYWAYAKGRFWMQKSTYDWLVAHLNQLREHDPDSILRNDGHDPSRLLNHIIEEYKRAHDGDAKQGEKPSISDRSAS